MKQRLQRILSILCILALFTGCLAVSASAEDLQTRIITVEWDDQDDYDGLRPTSIQASIAGKTVVLSAATNWNGEAEAPETEEWKVQEISGYKASTIGKGITTVIYRHTVEEKTVSASVQWQDADNYAKLRPDSVQLTLLADGQPFRAAVIANAENNWTVSWQNLPVNKKGGAAAIEYSVAQVETPEAYTTSAAGTTVTNVLKTGTLGLQVTVSGLPEDADPSALRLTVTGPDPNMPVTLTYGQLAGGTYDFGSVLAGAYVVQESNADTIAPWYAVDTADSRVGDAVYVDAGEGKTLSVRFAWKEPEEQEVNMEPLADIDGLSFEIIGPNGFDQVITYAQFSDGKYELDNLLPGEYAVIERNAEGLVHAYTLASESTTGIALTVGKDGAKATLFNSYVPTVSAVLDDEVIEVPVTKIWVDNNNEDGNRPKEVQVTLFADGVKDDECVITAADNWQYIFNDKPRYNDEGNEIVYTVMEENVDAWYTAKVDGLFITNTYKPEVTSVAVVKNWDDNENKTAGIRPTTLAVTLLPVGKVYVLEEAKGWKVEVGDLPTRINGEPVTYSWTEQEVPGYKKGNPAVNGNVTSFTNTLIEVPEVKKEEPQPDKPTGKTWTLLIGDYETALGIEVVINHVGDCFD